MGYSRIHETLEHDYNINDKCILRICWEKKIQFIIRHRYNCCTMPAFDSAYIAENVLNRELHARYTIYVTDDQLLMFIAIIMIIRLYSVPLIKLLQIIQE